MDIAYAFKRNYEDSIVRFIRQSSHQDETSKADENSHCKVEQNEDEQYEPMSIRVRDVNQLSYTWVNDSSIEQEIDIEDMDMKLFMNLTPEPSIDDTSNSPTYDEMAGQSIGNEYESTRIESSEESMVQVHDERQAVQGSSSILHSCHDTDFDTEPKYSPNLTSCSTPPITVKSVRSLNPGLYKQRKIDDDISCLPLSTLPQSEQTNMMEDNQKLKRKQAEAVGCSNAAQNQDLPKLVLTNQAAADTDSEGKQVHYRVLRSNSHRIVTQEPLTKDVLNKIYRNHHGTMKPYRCDVCFRWFKTKGHIKTHRLRHIQRDRMIECTKCLSTFLTMPHFSNHRCFHNFC